MDAKAFGLMAAWLVLTGAVLLWIRRRTWTDHNVSDPGVTLYASRIPNPEADHSASGPNRRPVSETHSWERCLRERLMGFEERSESGVVGGPSAHQGYLQ